MPSSHTDSPRWHWFSHLTGVLDPRSASRFILLLVGAVRARGPRTVTTWIRAAGLSRDYRPCYTTIAAAGKKAYVVAARLAGEVVPPLVADSLRLVFALDDTPTPRYGPHVQGPASTTTRPPARPAVPSCTVTCGWSWRPSSHTPCGA